MKNENIQIVRKVLLWLTPNFYTTLGEKNELRSKKCNFCLSNDFCWKKCKKASGKYLAGILPPQLNFDSAKLIFFEFPEEKKYKIQNFKLKVFFFFAREIFARGGQISKVLFLARKLKISKFEMKWIFWMQAVRQMPWFAVME
jgi:hypothetical protein